MKDDSSILEVIKVACPKEFETAKDLPIEVLEALYPYAGFGPAFPEILQMHSHLRMLMVMAMADDPGSVESLYELETYVRNVPNATTHSPLVLMMTSTVYAGKFKNLCMTKTSDFAGFSKVTESCGIDRSTMNYLFVALSLALTTSKTLEQGEILQCAKEILSRWEGVKEVNLISGSSFKEGANP